MSDQRTQRDPAQTDERTQAARQDQDATRKDEANPPHRAGKSPNRQNDDPSEAPESGDRKTSGNV